MFEYPNFQSFKAQHKAGVDYQIRERNGESGILLMAPHGGGIEPGTTEIADAVAGKEHAFYTFSGIRKKRNRLLHVTSRLFDEPRALDMVRRVAAIVAIHGCRQAAPVVYTGGRYKQLRRHIDGALTDAGFSVGQHPKLPGLHPTNICNRGRCGMGVQLEISAGLRHEIFGDPKPGQKLPKTVVFSAFVVAVRAALSEYLNAHPASIKEVKK